jgi:hypothetical protein
MTARAKEGRQFDPLAVDKDIVNITMVTNSLCGKIMLAFYLSSY